MSEALNLTLAADSANDLPVIVSQGSSSTLGGEPMPSKSAMMLLQSTAYLCVWDILVSKNFVPEA